MSYRAIQEGAAGVDMGRNIFQSDAPHSMTKAVNRVVHENLSPTEAYEYFQSIRVEG
jgi:putative autoinducer-2 (AI-2) aldolase